MTLATQERIQSHAQQLGTLLPPGRAWSRELGGPQAVFLEGLGHEFANLEARVADLLREQDPQHTLELLTEWELAFGLPDPCTGVPDTIEARRAALVARLVVLTGGSASDLVGLAATLGYQIRVIEHRPFVVGRGRVGDALTNGQKAFRVGQSRVGDRLSNQEAWLFTVDIVAPITTVRRFAVGRSVVGERLATWNNNVLECTLARVAPAHVLLRFLYENQLEAALLSSTLSNPAPLLAFDFDEDEFDMLRHQTIVLTNATADGTEPWNLLSGATTLIELASAFVTSEMVRNGGHIRWRIAGFYVNDSGSPIDVELAIFNDEAGTPLFTCCIEGIPSDAGSVTGAFAIQVDLAIRNTGDAHGSWRSIFNPKIVADGSTASGQAAPHFDGDVFKMWSPINWNTDVRLVPKLRKKASSTALVKPFEIACVILPARSGVGAEG